MTLTSDSDRSLQRSTADRVLAMRPLLCGVVILIGTVVLLGWATGTQRLMSVLPGMISMKINTAGGLILLAVALYGVDRRSTPWAVVVWLCLLMAMLLAGGTLVEYAADVDLRIDDAIVHDAVSVRYPGRMAPATAIVLLSVGIATAMLRMRRAVAFAQAVLLVSSAAPLTTLGGYLYRAPAMYAAAPYPVIALHTSIGLMLLCIAGLFTYPDRALMSIVTARTLAGSMARRLLPAALAVPIIVGLGVLAGARANWYSIAFGSALLVACCGMFFAAVVWWTTSVLARAESAESQAQASLADARRRSEAALLAGEIGTFDWDIPGDKVYGDANFARLFALTLDPTRGFPIGDYLKVIHPDDRAIVEEKVSRTIAESVPYEAEYRIVHRDGRERWVVARGRVERDAAGRPVRFPGVVVDVTERKLAEADAAVQQRQLELIFRVSPAAMALWRGEQLVFERVNPQYQDLFRGRELTGKPLLEACPELRGQGFDELLHKVLRTGEPHVGREMLARIVREKDGEIEDHYFDFTYQQVKDPQGRPWGVYNHAVDVTDRVLARKAMERSEQQLQESLAERQFMLENEQASRREVERAGQLKDEFLATLSHELRTPLNAILGWAQMLKVKDPKAETVATGLATIERNARAQTQIIGDLLDMSGIISGKVSLNPQPIDLAAVLRAAVETVRPTAANKQVQVVYEATDDERLPIIGDLNRLQQVFWNLLSNAIKFTPRNGVARVHVEQRHSMWQVDVIDNGEGISADFLPYVFDRFRQADASTTRRHGGLGLGLAIVKQLVELHGGIARARSDGPGLGATFTVSLPVRVIHDEVQKPVVAAASDAAPSGEATTSDAPNPTDGLRESAGRDDVCGQKILIVDDEPDAREMLKRLFEQHRATVCVAATADEALDLLHRDKFDVLVSDIGMPVCDGYELIHRVRQLPADQGGNIPAIALTAYARTEDRTRAIRAGFQMHIPKPVEPAELMAMVASVVR